MAKCSAPGPGDAALITSAARKRKGASPPPVHGSPPKRAHIEPSFGRFDTSPTDPQGKRQLRRPPPALHSPAATAPAGPGPQDAARPPPKVKDVLGRILTPVLTRFNGLATRASSPTAGSSPSAGAPSRSGSTAEPAAPDAPPPPPLPARTSGAGPPQVVRRGVCVGGAGTLASAPGGDAQVTSSTDGESETDETDSEGEGAGAGAGGTANMRDNDEDELEEDDEDDDCLEFDPYAFIKALPPLETCAPRPRRCLLPRQTRRCKRKTLVLDLDETLVHSTLDGVEAPDFTFPVAFNERRHLVHVRRRPHLEPFLERCAALFEVVVFTASQKVYAEQLLNILDPHRRLIRHRVFRDSCVFVEGNYLKDLTVLGRDLAHTIIVDNSPQAFGFQLANGIPIESWYEDAADDELPRLLPFLESLVEAEDVRPAIADAFKLHLRVARAPDCMTL